MRVCFRCSVVGSCGIFGTVKQGFLEWPIWVRVSMLQLFTWVLLFHVSFFWAVDAVKLSILFLGTGICCDVLLGIPTFFQAIIQEKTISKKMTFKNMFMQLLLVAGKWVLIAVIAYQYGLGGILKLSFAGMLACTLPTLWMGHTMLRNDDTH